MFGSNADLMTFSQQELIRGIRGKQLLISCLDLIADRNFILLYSASFYPTGEIREAFTRREWSVLEKCHRVVGARERRHFRSQQPPRAHSRTRRSFNVQPAPPFPYFPTSSRPKRRVNSSRQHSRRAHSQEPREAFSPGLLDF